MYLGIHRFTQIRSFSHEKYEKDISSKLSFCCLFVVCAGIYFDLKNKWYSLSTALVRKGYSHTLNHMRTLNMFVETFFSPDSFGLASSFFLSFVFSTNRIFSRINNLTIQTRTTSLQNKYSYLNAVKRSINTSSTP